MLMSLMTYSATINSPSTTLDHFFIYVHEIHDFFLKNARSLSFVHGLVYYLFLFIFCFFFSAQVLDGCSIARAASYTLGLLEYHTEF